MIKSTAETKKSVQRTAYSVQEPLLYAAYSTQYALKFGEF